MLTQHTPSGPDRDDRTVPVSVRNHAVLHTRPALPSSYNRQIPRDLDAICLKCLAKNPQERYGTAHDLAEDLHRFLNLRPVTARRSSPLRRVCLGARRNCILLIGLLICVLGVGIFAGLVKWSVDADTRAKLEKEEGAADANRRTDRLLAKTREAIDTAKTTATNHSNRLYGWKTAKEIATQAVDEAKDVRVDGEKRSAADDLLREATRQFHLARALVACEEIRSARTAGVFSDWEPAIAGPRDSWRANASDAWLPAFDSRYQTALDDLGRSLGFSGFRDALRRDAAISLRDLAEYLDDWAEVLHVIGTSPEKRREVWNWANDLDTDPVRRRIRLAMLGEDSAEISNLVKDTGLSPHSARVLAGWLLHRKDYVTAVRLLEAVHQRHPREAHIVTKLGFAYLFASPPHLDAAVECFVRAQALGPTASSANCLAIAKLIRRKPGDWADAEKELREPSGNGRQVIVYMII